MDLIKEVVIATATPTAKIQENIVVASTKGLKRIDELFGELKDEPIALVGGGPSLEQTMHLLDGYNTIIIAGSAHDYFVDHFYRYVSSMPKMYCLICDPDPIMVRYLQNWSSNITYLIASQCDISMFKHLEDAPSKYLWHAAGGDDFNRSSFPEGESLIVGGCTVGTRAIGMAMAMGYKKIHLFGYDSCLTSKYKHHAYDFVDEEKESLGDIREVKLGSENSPMFRVAGYMLGQIFDFKHILVNYADKLQIEVFGDGALAYIMKEGHKKMLKHKEEQNGARN